MDDLSSSGNVADQRFEHASFADERDRYLRHCAKRLASPSATEKRRHIAALLNYMTNPTAKGQQRDAERQAGRALGREKCVAWGADSIIVSSVRASASRFWAFLAKMTSTSVDRAFQADLWGGTIPASPATVAVYLADHAERLSVATLVRRIASISKAHEARTVPNPCRSELVRATMRGIKRRRGCGQDQAKPLLKEDLFQVLDAMGDGVKAARDRALLLIGFAGGFRRSEIVGLDVADLEKVRQGLIVHLRRSKTDQDGTGRKIGIPFGRTRYCPVLAVERWLEISGIEAGAIFRPINRHGQVAPGRLSGDAVSVIVKELAAGAGHDPTGFSGHSLRAGFATSAAQAGVSTWKIRAQTGHASDAMLSRYVRDGE